MRDILARFTLISTREGGRQTSIANGYRPAFYIRDFQTDGAVFLMDRTELSPGESCDVRIKLLHPEHFGVLLKTGAELVVKEGLKAVGRVVILKMDEVEIKS